MKTLTKAVGSSMDGFLVQHSETTKVAERPETTTRNQGNAATGTIGSFLTATCNECLHAEILWTLKVVQSHYSFHSCSDVQQLFAQMIPDSEITKQFSCGEKKCAYLCNFGIAPHFKQLLKNAVADQHGYVLLFDESLNKKTHNKQMDIHCRFWGNDGQVQIKLIFSINL